MKIRPLFVALSVVFMLADALFAQAPGAKAPEKSPADLAGEAFGKIYNDQGGEVVDGAF